MFLVAILCPPLTVLVSAQPTTQWPIPADKRRAAVGSIRERIANRAPDPKRVAELKAKIDAAKAGKIDPSAPGILIPAAPSKRNPITFPTKMARDKFADQVETDLRQERDIAKTPVSNPEPFVPFLGSYKKDTFGLFVPDRKLGVIKVVDKKTAIVVVNPSVEGPPVSRFDFPPPLRVIVSGIDTSGMADMTPADPPPGVFYVLGNRELGGRTYLHLVPFRFTPEETNLMVGRKP